MSTVRWSAWHHPEDAPANCECRKAGRDEGLVSCGGWYGGPDDCTGFDGYVRADGMWAFELPPAPPNMRKMGRYDKHAYRAVELRTGDGDLTRTEACRLAIREFGRGKNWPADDEQLGVPRGLYERVGALERAATT